MSESEQEYSSSSLSEGVESDLTENNEYSSALMPYENEPLADEEDGDDEDDDDDDDDDEDGLSPLILERRYDGTDSVQTWCMCNHCNVEKLDSALEFRCCREVQPVLNLFCFEGIDTIKCITEHPDFEPMTHRTVLKHVAPLIKDKQGRRYRRQPGRSENELLRATAYRWLIRWLCGYRGWDNARPLSACIYHNIRSKLQTHNVTGYASAQQRNT